MILVDSDVLIAHLRGVAVARDWLVGARNDGPLAISAVSIVELIGGMRTVKRREVWRLLASFVWSRRLRWSRAALGTSCADIGAATTGLDSATISSLQPPTWRAWNWQPSTCGISRCSNVCKHRLRSRLGNGRGRDINCRPEPATVAGAAIGDPVIWTTNIGRCQPDWTSRGGGQ
jgi:hypothetical protein